VYPGLFLALGDPGDRRRRKNEWHMTVWKLVETAGRDPLHGHVARLSGVLIVTIARDRASDSEDCYVLVVLFLFIFYLFLFIFIFLFCFFGPPIFRRSWADFRETLPHDAVCPEIVYLL